LHFIAAIASKTWGKHLNEKNCGEYSGNTFRDSTANGEKYAKGEDQKSKYMKNPLIIVMPNG